MEYLPKYNLEAEQNVLGAVMFDETVMSEIFLSEEDFYKSAHKKIFAAMQALAGKSEPIDIIALAEVLDKSGALEAVGGRAYLANLVTQVPTAANIRYHAKMVSENAKARKMQSMCMDMLSIIAENQYENSDEMVMKVNATLNSIVSSKNRDIISMKDVIKDTFDYIERRADSRDSVSGIPSGFKDIDSLTDGFQSGEMNLLAARPSMGKTALAMAIAENAAKAQWPVGVIEIEMGKQQLGLRSLSSASGIRMQMLRRGIMARSDWQRLTEGAGILAELPIYFGFSMFSLPEIQKAIMLMVQKNKIKLLIIDYLQLARYPGQKSREREIAEISLTLRNMTKACDISTLALCQLNRQVETREDKRPKLSDLRESGSLEQDADVVLFLYRDNPREHRGVVEVIVGKGRNIGLGTAKLVFDGDLMQFKNYSDEEELYG